MTSNSTTNRTRPWFSAVLATLALAVPAAAQDMCPCPPKPGPGWDGSIGAGLSLNGGNSDDKSFNVNATATHDPQKKNVVKLSGLYLRTDSGGEKTTDKTTLLGRDEYKVSERAFLFGDLPYQRDPFKDLDYLVAPTIGGGYKLVNGAKLTFDLDAGVALAIEKLTDRDGTTDGALRAGQHLVYKISDNAKFVQNFGAIWKFSDFDDAYYRVEATLTTSVARRLDLKLSYIADVKNKPASPDLDKLDSTFVAAIVFKFRPS